MNNTQLYLSIGIPTLTVLLTWLSTHRAMQRVGDKIDATGLMLREQIYAIIRQSQDDTRRLREYLVPLHERMAKLEPRN